MTIYERIRDLREKRGLSQQELADALGYTSRSSIAKIEKGVVDLPQTKILAFAKVLGVTPAFLMGWENAEPVSQHASAQAIRIPVLGSIPAGIPLEAVEDIIDWEEIPADWTRGGQEFFSLKVHGDSMSPRYEDGDVLILRKQDTCESGQDCAVMVDGSDATFKRVRISPAGVTLQPLNPEYDPLVFSNREVQELPVRILGVVVELRRSVG